MNSRQRRRNRHAIKMAKHGLVRFGRRMSYLMMKPSPFFIAISQHANHGFDGGTYISESIIYKPLNADGWDGNMGDLN